MARTLEQILATEQQEIVADAKKMADDILTQLRERMQLTQAQLAAALGVTQPTISEMDQPGRDLKLSSLKRYVENAGGKPIDA